MAKVRTGSKSAWMLVVAVMFATALTPAAAGADTSEPVSITIDGPREGEILDFEVIPSGTARGVTADAIVRVAMRHDDTGLWVDDHYSLSNRPFLWTMHTSEVWPDGSVRWGYGDVIRIFEGNYSMYAFVRDANGTAHTANSYSAEWYCYECGPPATSIDSPTTGQSVQHPIAAEGSWYKWNGGVNAVQVGVRFADGSFYAGPDRQHRQITWFEADLCCSDSTNSGTWSIERTFKLRPGDYTLVARAVGDDWQANPAQTPFTVEATTGATLRG